MTIAYYEDIMIERKVNLKTVFLKNINIFVHVRCRLYLLQFVLNCKIFNFIMSISCSIHLPSKYFFCCMYADC